MSTWLRPAARFLKFRKGVSPCQGKTGRLPHNLPPQKANFGKGKIAKFKREVAILGQILARWPFWKVQKAKMREVKAQKAKMKGNDGPKGENEEMKAQKAKMKGNEGPKGQNERK